MKKHILLIINIIVATLIFSSCTLTKRHYNNGYYVEHKKSKTPQKINNTQQKIVKNKPEIIKDSTYNSEQITNVTKKTNASENYNVEKIISEKKIIKRKTYGNIKKPNMKVASDKALLASKSKKLFIESQDKKNASDGDGLSLFWVVILILLLLWFFGFIFLANALLHLLLVLAIVLLILWLLRII
jgi:hypothetical protein